MGQRHTDPALGYPREILPWDGKGRWKQRLMPVVIIPGSGNLELPEQVLTRNLYRD